MSTNEIAESRVDPWLNTIIDCNASVSNLQFEDKFQPKKCDCIIPLDDSQSYLATLERKLAKLRSVKKDQKIDLLRAVEDTRDSYMRRIISCENRETLDINEDAELETPVTPKPINSWIKPEQAVTVGELAELLKNDSLASSVERT